MRLFVPLPEHLGWSALSASPVRVFVPLPEHLGSMPFERVGSVRDVDRWWAAHGWS
jgi:hypothetical protein